MPSAPRYTVTKALADCRGTRLYRAIRSADRLPVILKVLDSQVGQARDIECLKHEHELGKILDSRFIVKPLALDTYRGRPALVLEDSGGESLDHLLGAPMEIERFLRLAIAIAAAVAGIHSQEIVHKNLKPQNILVSPAGDEVKLTDFGLASRVPREQRPAQPLRLIEGSLPYLSPEQTGRASRAIDERTDLYSLGITFYEMLTGGLPFEAHDPVEWVHCHVACIPSSPSETVPELPGMIASIVLKLLSKMPEDRYQSARGLRLDLERCLEQWRATGKIEPFTPGERDTAGHLQIPQKLYGREAEIALLLQAFGRVVATGTPELLLVSGYAGSGKTSLVHELYRKIVRTRALFLSGKFDQYKHDIPYATLVQAFRERVLEILAESEPQISEWKQQLLSALGINAQLIVDVIPEVELVIGRQPPAPELPSAEAQNRFRLVFRQFIGVFARKEHPLALFLDDLQWADQASLGLLEGLVTSSDIRYLLVIGAYRDNEVSPSHPLMLTLDEVRKEGARVADIALGPIPREQLAAFVSEALHCSVEEVAPLADLVYEKTAGNPFFAIQFLLSLHEERLIEVDGDGGAFRWDMARIRAKNFTDNVVELMVGKLRRLPAQAQEALKQLACLGNSAEVAALALVHGRSEDDTHADLWEVARAGLVLRSNDRYKFLHDRVQEAAYSLIPEGERAAVHLEIGRLLLAHTAPGQLDEEIFAIVNQLNRGAALIRSREERERVAELNLIAGKRARGSTAYGSALTYLSAGSALLEQDSWDRRYELTFALELYRAECEYLTAELSAAEARLAMLSRRARSLADAAAVTCVRVALYTNLDRSDRGVEACLDYLRRIGVEWSPHPTDEEVRKELERMWRQLGSRSIEELVSLPRMTDGDCRATMDVLTDTMSPALFTDENLLGLVVGHMANLSLEHGNGDASCFAYVMLGMILGSRFGDYQAAFRFGKLGIDLVEQGGLDRFRARVYLNFGHSINPWTRHVRTSLEFLRRGFRTARETGDLAFAAYNCSTSIVILLAAGEPLGEVQREAEEALEFTQKARFGLVVDTIVGQLRLIRTLRGLTPDFSSFNDAEFDEGQFEQHLEANPRLAMAACWYWIRKLQARFHAGDYVSALAAASRVEPLLWTSPSFFVVAEYHFYRALARAAHHDTAPADERPQLLEALVAQQKRLEVWAENGRENFENRVALVGAEIARIEGRDLDAMRLYEEAIRSAREGCFVHNEAIACETAARFYRARGFDRIADTYLREARSGYVRWGADGKVQSLDRHHPELVDQPCGASPSTSTFVAMPAQLDLLSLVKASQSISSEIVLPRLAETLLKLMLQQAGGQRGALFLVRDGEPTLQAEATTDGKEIRVESLPGVPTSAEAFPLSILHYVTRTREPVILDDAAASARFSSDEHILRKHPRSLLCFPIVRQARVSGLMCLENNLVTGAFTADTIHVLELLGAQAAISLDNATLYADLERSRREIAAVLDNMVDSVFVVDRMGHVTLVNQAAARLTGLASPGEALGPMADLARRIHLDQPTRTPNEAKPMPILRALGGETVTLDEGRFSLPGSARIRYLHTSASPIRDAGAQVVGAVAVSRDVTELVELDRLKDQFLRVAAHELKTPVAVVMGYAETLSRMAKELAPDQRRMLDGLLRGAGRINRIVADLLFLSQVQLDRLNLVMERVDLGELVEQAARRATQAAPTRRVRITRAEPVVLEGDRELLGRVVAHLIDNAMRYSPDGGEVEVNVRLGGAQDAIVSVRDHGVGIPAGKCAQIFECFYRAHTDTSHDYGGMGTGLYLSRTVVARHGGEMWFESEEGRGSTFHVRLPLTHEGVTAPR